MTHSFFHKLRFILGSFKRTAYLSFLFFLSSGLDLLGIGLLNPFMLIIFDRSLASKIPLLSTMPWLSGKEGLCVLGALIVLVFILKSAMTVFVQHRIYRHCYNQSRRLIHRLVKNYQSMSYEEYVEENSSQVISMTLNSTNYFMIYVLIPLLQNVASLISISMIVLFACYFLGPLPTLSAIASIGLILLAYDKVFRSYLKRTSTLVRKSHNNMHKHLSHAFKGYKEIRILGKENHFRKRIDHEAMQFSDSVITEASIRSASGQFVELLLMSLIVIATIVSVYRAANPAHLFAKMAISVAACFRLLPLLKILNENLSRLRHAEDHVNALYKALQPRKQTPLATTPSPPFETLELSAIEYTYPNNSSPTLKAIDFSIKKGDMIGFIGKSGCGKTTLIHIILRLIEPQKGRILFNGEERSPSIHYRFSYIPQDIFLADTTLAGNIALGEEQIDHEKLRDAIAMAKLDELIATLENGIHTPIGEHGVKLSGGQRQRLGIARALYFDADLLILDEATSALDQNTESEVMSHIALLKGIKTILIISHRHSILSHCDRIYSMEDGRLQDTLLSEMTATTV